MSSVPGRLAGLVAVITGGNQGMGRAIAERFAAEGARLFLMDLRDDQFPDIASAAQAVGSESAGRKADVTRPDDVEAAMTEAERHYGQIDVLVTAAGVFQARAFLDYPLEDWNQVMAVNVTGTMLACQAALRRMVPRGQGRLITMASAAGRAGGRFRAGYSTSKHAVVGLTRCLAIEFAGQGITANAICPGMIETDMFDAVVRQDAELLGRKDIDAMKAELVTRSPQKRMIDPAEIAGIAAYLASPEARSYTGQTVGLDGGMVMT